MLTHSSTDTSIIQRINNPNTVLGRGAINHCLKGGKFSYKFAMGLGGAGSTQPKIHNSGAQKVLVLGELGTALGSVTEVLCGPGQIVAFLFPCL